MASPAGDRWHWLPRVVTCYRCAVDDCFPTAPEAPQDVIGSLITYAERCAAYLEAEHEQARLHGHVVQGQTLGNLEGYRFTARFLRESYALPDPSPR